MRIFHLEASPGWGGQEMRILKEAEGMRKRGHEVILAVQNGGGLIGPARAAGFLVYEMQFQKKSWPLTLLKLLFCIRKHEIDVVNTHSSLDAWIGGMAARLLRTPVVRTRHLSTAVKAGLNSRLLYGKLADFVVTTCASIIPMIASQSRKEERLFLSVATGVDPEKIAYDPKKAQEFRETLPVKPDDFLVGTACFMRSWKGIVDLLEAADRLRHLPELKWVIIGGGHIETYKAKAKELKLEGIVHFTGHLADPFPAIGALDAFLLLSTAHEGVSQAILQAAYLEKPLIATATGGLGEVCLEGVTGFQVPPFSPESVASKVLLLKADHSLRRALGARGKKLVLERFTLEHTLDAMERVYQSL